MLEDWIVTDKPDSNITIILETNAIDLDKAQKAKDNRSYIDKINL